MTQRDNILNELNELGSTLLTASASNIYHVPSGYFEEFAGQLLNRIRTMEAGDSKELSPVLEAIGRVTPYKVPAGYFDNLEEKLTRVAVQTGDQTPQEELENLSPLLSGLKKQVPYSVPDNYFEKLTINEAPEKAGKTKIISLTGRTWFRYAVAAVVVGIIAVSSFLLFNRNQQADSPDKSYAWVKKNIKKISSDELDKFIDIAEEEAPVVASTSPATEVKELVKNISDKEIQDFLKDAQDAEPDSNDDILLN